jgi:class 3 adenylate cyclase
MKKKFRYRLFLGSILVSSAILGFILTITSFKTLQVDKNFSHLIHEENEALLINSLRFGHAMMARVGEERYQGLIDIALKSKFILYLSILDDEGHVIAQSQPLPGFRVKDSYDTDRLGDGIILRETNELIFTSYVAEKNFSDGELMGTPDPRTDLKGEDHGHPAWYLVGLDVSFFKKHYNDMLIQTIAIAAAIFVFGILAVIFVWIVQRYELAHLSIERLQKIKRMLSNFVPETAKKIIEDDPEKALLDKSIRDATVLFLDIESFTILVQEYPQERVNRVVENYFSLFLDVIQKNGGDINETAGDGLMVIFLNSDRGEHAKNAIRTSLEIKRKCIEISQMGDIDLFPIQVNIGISSGEVYLGSTKMRGAGGDRWTFTASGKVTILAARLSQFGRGAQILVSEETASRNGAGFSMKPLGTVALKNLKYPSKIFQVMDK